MEAHATKGIVVAFPLRHVQNDTIPMIHSKDPILYKKLEYNDNLEWTL